jgi:hypothetical protein
LSPDLNLGLTCCKCGPDILRYINGWRFCRLCLLIVSILCPYHPDLNPIKLVGAELKKNVGNKNITFKFSDVISLADKFFEEEFSIEKWSKICNRVERLEKEFISKEPTIDLVVEQLIINLGEDSNTESEYSSAEELDFDALEGIEELDVESVPNQSEVTSSLTYTVW